ncbi:unnamed protein product [Lymnaea stagnalis]|uniref:Solute carrier family 35 member F2 n=1 Tax=Lymnaea stagnalis TaxID=6523 RepID=A0AAV2HFF2_LYMST
MNVSACESLTHTSEDSVSNDLPEPLKEPSIIKQNKWVSTLKKAFSSRNFLKSLILGQCLSLLLCGTGVFSTLLQIENVNVPTAQSFLVYFALGIVFTTQLAYKPGKRNLVNILRSWDGLKYAIIGLIDVEANYLVVKAYNYTSITSVQILDCFSIAVVLILSKLLLHTHYRWTHYIGVAVSVLGLGGLVAADVITGKNHDDGTNVVLGDFLVISGAVLYGISNVAQEFVVKNFKKSEFLGMLGLFSTFISGIQVILVERDELSRVNFSSYKVVLPWLGFFFFLFMIYICMSYVIQKTSATVTNISVLSADFYALIFGIFLFGYTFHILYVISFIVVIVGVAVYTLRPTDATAEGS